MIQKDYTIEDLNMDYFSNYLYLKKDEYKITSSFSNDNVVTIEFDETYESDMDNYIENYNGNNPPLSLTIDKIKKITEEYRKLSMVFASENSVTMSQLGYDYDKKKSFVRKAADAFAPIKKEMELYSYYDIWDMFDNIERDEVLTDDRINNMKDELFNIIFGV